MMDIWSDKDVNLMVDTVYFDKKVQFKADSMVIPRSIKESTSTVVIEHDSDNTDLSEKILSTIEIFEKASSINVKCKMFFLKELNPTMRFTKYRRMGYE